MKRTRWLLMATLGCLLALWAWFHGYFGTLRQFSREDVEFVIFGESRVPFPLWQPKETK